MKKQLLLCLSLAGVFQANAQLCLGPTTNYGTNTTPYTLCIGDFNNDGKKDIATANWSPNNVSVMLGDGMGGFGIASTFTVGNGPQGICSADFNADGNADLAVSLAFSGTNKVGILLGNGSGGFGSATTFTVGAGPISICTGDFNSDGKADLATCNYTANNVSVVLGNGNGTFGAVTNVITMSSSPYQIICADFNNDGKPDLATADNATMGDVSVYWNQGSGTFAMGSLVGTGNYANTYGLCAGDFNGDNQLDIAATYFGSGAVTIIPNNGGGTFGTETTFTVGTSPVAICAADFDGDSKLDVGVTNYNGGPQFWVMQGDGAGNLGTGVSYNVGTNPYAVLAYDFDGNGKMDVAMSNYNSANVSVLLNKAPDSGISGSLAICSGNGTTLSANPALTYSWSTGGTGSSEFVTPGVGTTSYTVTTSNGACSVSSVAIVTVTPTPTLSIAGNLNICSGSSTILSGGTASSYTWSSNAGSVNTSTVSVSPGSTDTYTLDGSNGNCFASAYATVNVTSTPTVNITGTMAICSGNSTTLTGSAAGNYTWSSGGNAQSEMVSPTSTASYTLTEANGVCTGFAVATVTVTPTPTVTITGGATICLNASEILTGLGATTYTWSANAGSATTSTVSVNPMSGTTYSVTGGTPLQGGIGECTGTASQSVSVLTPPAPVICMVTTDSLSTYNTIFWDKTGYTGIDSFIVYREVSTNTYHRIGAVSKDSMSLFNDTSRSVGPANGDPNIGYYHYKLQIRDSCGNYSQLSPYHTSVYVNDLHNGSFSWNTYDVEGQSTPVANFILKRDNNNTGNYQTIGTVSGSTTILNDPNYGTYQSVANWRVDATGFNCTPTQRYGNNATQATIVKSKSNISNNRTTHVNQQQASVSVYPNPANNELNISVTGTPGAHAYVLNMFGESVKSILLDQTITKVDLSGLAAGVYYVKITSGTNLVKLEKVIVQR